jgi:coenzyme F420-reducing hydrogenase beta subunit
MIKKILKENCTACQACSNVCPQKCISMEVDYDGFYYPFIDESKCLNCGLCIKVCPSLNKNEVDNHPKAFACSNNDENIRLQSSSGGMFSLIAEYVLANDGVVFGAKFDQDFRVIHDFVQEKDKLQEFRGSKYVQSEIRDVYTKTKDFLDAGRWVLFTGTPCQIDGLKSFLGKPFDYLFTADIICHGVPSPRVWLEYISYREKMARAKTKRIAFRRKDEGWKLFSVSFIFQNDTEYRQTFNNDPYMKAFLKNICLRSSCYVCGFKTLHRQSDITLADFWGIQNILPGMDDDKGTSLIIINSKKGQEIFEQVKKKMRYKEVDIEKALAYNTSAVKAVAYNPKREKFFAELGKLSFDNLVKKYCTDRRLLRIKRKIKIMICFFLKRSVYYHI